ncbi:MAG: Nif3-like dinuclear metal center hexameric protein [Clostridia bacterium]|nr:Nif3-like dinuclear metal center hexameric protein [Clostridia bacterium]
MKLSEIYELADSIAPKKLSDELCERYNHYDNSGILVDCGEEIKGMVFSLDLSNAAIDKALSTGANLIMTHHPAIYGKIGSIRYDDGALLGGKLIRCIKNGISVLSMHLNLDAAKDGIDESLMEGVLLAAEKTTGAGTGRIEECKANATYMQTVSEGGYGRVYDLPTIEFSTLVENIKTVFSTERIEAYGNGKRISRVASFCGAGADEGSIAFAKRMGADAIVSSDFKHHLIALAQESGLAIISLTHFASETYGFKKYYEKIRRQTEIPCVYHTDDNLL